MSVMGEVTSQDTLRAQKDILVNGNAKIAGELGVSGNTNLQPNSKYAKRIEHESKKHLC